MSSQKQILLTGATGYVGGQLLPVMNRYAVVAGRRTPRILRVPVLTPRLSAHWVGFVTPVETSLAKPLVQGLSAETIVRRPPPPGLNDEPLGFDDAVRAALAG